MNFIIRHNPCARGPLEYCLKGVRAFMFSIFSVSWPKIVNIHGKRSRTESKKGWQIYIITKIIKEKDTLYYEILCNPI